MAFEIPYDQIRELQISLRKEAGLSSYNPEEEKADEASFPNLPSIQDAISQIDPSPSYLRCKHCNGRLLRGVNSNICVFCGRQKNKDVPPDPIKFTSTFGYRWFLHSLDLDGSELVAPPVEANKSNRGQIKPEIEFPLSDLLNLEIRWSEPEKVDSSISEKTPTQTLNLAGIDIDNYFTESKIDSGSASIEGRFANKLEDASGGNTFQHHENLSLFENVEPSGEVARTEDDKSGNSFSGWEANFQSAEFGIQSQESKFSDPSVGSSSVDLSSHMDAVFGPGKDLSNEKTKENVSDWFEGDIWNNANTGISFQNDEFEVTNDKVHGIGRNTGNSSFVNVGLIQDNQWPTYTSGSKETDNNKIVDEEDDSFDAWSGFTSSSNVQFPTSISLKDDNYTVPSFKQASEISLFSGTNNSKDVNCGSFPQPDLFSETFSQQNGYSEMDFMMPESSFSDRVGGMDGTSAEEVENSGNSLVGNTKSKASDVETLMSQMHDLSFMLASNLSVPEKKDPPQTMDPFGSFSKD